MAVRRRGEPDDPEARRLASRELGRAKRSILAIRNFYIANTILWGVLFALLVLAYLGRPAPFRNPMALLIPALALGLSIAGIVKIMQQPFLWSILIASVWTLFEVAYFYGGGSLKSMWALMGIGWTLGCWMMLPATVRVNKLVARYPDLWISKKMRPGGRLRRSGRRR